MAKSTPKAEISEEQLDKFTWDRGSLELVEEGDGPTLKEIAEQQERAEREGSGQ